MSEEARFPAAFWGYRKNEVHKYLAELKREYDRKKEELAAGCTSALAEGKALAARLERLRAELEHYREQEQMLAKILIDAQIRGAAIERDAAEKAERVKREMTEEISLKRAELATFKKRVDRFRGDIIDVLDRCKVSLRMSDEPASGGDDGQSGFSIDFERRL